MLEGWWVRKHLFPTFQMAMKRTLDEDVPVLDGQVTVDLTGMASLSIGDDARDHLQPIVTKSLKPIFELRSELVSSRHTVMSFFERLMCLFVRRHQSKILSYDADTMFTWSYCNRTEELSFWWQLPLWGRRARCRIRWSQCKGIANPCVRGLLKSQEPLWLEGLLLEFYCLQGWICNSTSHDCR